MFEALTASQLRDGFAAVLTGNAADAQGSAHLATGESARPSLKDPPWSPLGIKRGLIFCTVFSSEPQFPVCKNKLAVLDNIKRHFFLPNICDFNLEH